MSSFTYEELKKKTVAQLREIAKELKHEAVQGYSQLNKEHLLKAICKALGIDSFTHHHAVGVDKTSIKARIKSLKQLRDESIANKDYKALKLARHRMHRLKRKLHKATV